MEHCRDQQEENTSLPMLWMVNKMFGSTRPHIYHHKTLQNDNCNNLLTHSHNFVSTFHVEVFTDRIPLCRRQ